MANQNTFKQAPLPFIGQKRMFLKQFEQILNENISDNGEGWTILDTFGGSGLLSHTAKRLKPKARVIYNDFDGYAERLAHIDDINQLRAELYSVVGNATSKNKRMTKDCKAECIRIIQNFKGYKDLNCLASWLLFSGQQVATLDDLFQHNFWHCIRQSDYPKADGYLDGVEIVKESFHTLLPKFSNDPKALFVLDPPYLCTKQESYKQATYFDLIDFLRLVNITRPPYVFFSSTKSEFIRFVNYMLEDKVDNWQAFENAKRITVNAKLNYQVAYEDNLVYKF
uniref:Hia5 n=1 Tax=Haemophilus influenzae TaxID=727 RepID=G9C944_HAEIF|nr:Hia5 [Haemophilus influenzae]